MSHSITPTVPNSARSTRKPGLLAHMLRLWLEHNQRLIDLRMGPF